jgi:hypothetical protein
MNALRWADRLQARRMAGKFLFLKSVPYAKIVTLGDVKN